MSGIFLCLPKQMEASFPIETMVLIKLSPPSHFPSFLEIHLTYFLLTLGEFM